MQTMSFKWCSKSCYIEAIEVFLNPYFYLINNKSPNYSGWETHKIQYGLQPWYAYNSVKYEVKPNPYGIEQILYLKDKGWFVAGEELTLHRVYR